MFDGSIASFTHKLNKFIQIYADSFIGIMSAFQTDKIEHAKTWINTWHAGGTFPAMMLGVYNQNGITVY